MSAQSTNPADIARDKELYLGKSSDVIATAAVLQAMAAGACAPHSAGLHHYAIVPQGFKVEPLTDLMERAELVPRRRRGTAQLKSIESLIEFCKDQAAESAGVVYADPDAQTITAVFNENRGAVPGWRDHRASFKCEFTPEFMLWKNNSGQPMDQLKFAEFIEDNLADITAPQGSQLLEVATTLQAKTDISFSSAKRLDNGQNQLQYTETINATAGAGGALQVPREFRIGVRIFKNGAGYAINARLKYRLHSGGVRFVFELDRPQRAIEDAFAGYVDMARSQLKYPVLLGTPG